MLYLPITVTLLYLYQLVLCKVRFSLFNLFFDFFQIPDIALRKERISRHFKWDTPLSADFLCKDGKCGCHRKPHICTNLFHALF